VTFARDVARAVEDGRPVQVWAGRESDILREAARRANRPLYRVEDGFLRSRGLGARLVPPLSLVQDDLGISYDPSRASRLERLIAEAAALDPARLRRAERLIATLTRNRITKYNLAPVNPLPELPKDRASHPRARPGGGRRLRPPRRGRRGPPTSTSFGPRGASIRTVTSSTSRTRTSRPASARAPSPSPTSWNWPITSRTAPTRSS
jgi:hypothetical protein